MDVVMKIVKVPTGNSGPHQNVPITPIIVEDAVLVTAAAGKDAAAKQPAAKK
jgi:peptidyl-prolyl cis-trans isomerase A (cyclophilin A)